MNGAEQQRAPSFTMVGSVGRIAGQRAVESKAARARGVRSILSEELTWTLRGVLQDSVACHDRRRLLNCSTPAHMHTTTSSYSMQRCFLVWYTCVSEQACQNSEEDAGTNETNCNQQKQSTADVVLKWQAFFEFPWTAPRSNCFTRSFQVTTWPSPSNTSPLVQP